MDEQMHIDWRSLAADVVKASRRNPMEKEITLQITVSDPPAVVYGNPVLLRMLLSNLVNNALRYTQQGGEVRVTLAYQHITVSDNGPGVMPGYLARLGERFYRPPGMVENGSGLGSSIVQRIARLHQFNVAWDNHTEGGFCVTLCFTDAA